MAEEGLSPAGNRKNSRQLDESRRDALIDINDRFGVGQAVNQLQDMMRRVTEREVTADTVNAAVNCVQGINNTIKTTIMAAKFLSGGD